MQKRGGPGSTRQIRLFSEPIELSAMYPILPSRIGPSPTIPRSCLSRPDQVIDNDQTGRNPNARLQGYTSALDSAATTLVARCVTA